MKPRILGIGTLILAAFVLVLLAVAAFGFAPVMPCPLGDMAYIPPRIDHLECGTCRHTGKITIAQYARLLAVNRGRWPQPRRRGPCG